MRSIFVLFMLQSAIAMFGQIDMQLLEKTDKIVISRIDWDALFDVSITCDAVEMQNFSAYKTLELSQVRKICKLLNGLEKVNSGWYDDYRCKIMFFREDSLLTSVCCSQDYVLIDGFYYKMSEQMIREIENVDTPDSVSNIKNLYQDVFPGGKRALYRYIQSELEAVKLPSVSLDLFIVVTIDREGNTTDVRTEYKNDGGIETDKWIDALKDILYNKVIWNKNNQRIHNHKMILKFKIADGS